MICSAHGAPSSERGPICSAHRAPNSDHGANSSTRGALNPAHRSPHAKRRARPLGSSSELLGAPSSELGRPSFELGVRSILLGARSSEPGAPSPDARRAERSARSTERQHRFTERIVWSADPNGSAFRARSPVSGVQRPADRANGVVVAVESPECASIAVARARPKAAPGEVLPSDEGSPGCASLTWAALAIGQKRTFLKAWCRAANRLLRLVASCAQALMRGFASTMH